MDERLGKRSATKKEILSFVGLLQHAAKVVRPGRTIVRRMYCTAAKVQELDYYTRLEFRSDLYCWYIFLRNWNKVSFLSVPHVPEIVIRIRLVGVRSILEWKMATWSSDWAPVTIMAKELVPIVLRCAVWGPLLRHKTANATTQVLSQPIKKGLAKEELVMHLLRSIWFFVVHFDISIAIGHIAGTHDDTANHSFPTLRLTCFQPRFQQNFYKLWQRLAWIGPRQLLGSCSTARSNCLNIQILSGRASE